MTIEAHMIEEGAPAIKLLPAMSQATALERRMSGRILRLHPGLGEKSMQMANALADSGMSPAMSSLLLLSVYSPAAADPARSGTQPRADDGKVNDEK